MNQDEQKEVYRLWWEYLKRSEDYKEFCGWMRKKREDRKTPVPEKFKPKLDKKGGKINHHIVLTFMGFGDVHAYTFEEWWDWMKEKMEEREQNKIHCWPKAIENYLVWYIETCIDSFETDKDGQGLTLEDVKRGLKKHFVEHVKRFDPGSLFLMIDPAKGKTKELCEEFKQIIIAKKKDPLVKGRERIYKQRAEPCTQVRIEALKRYLAVYDASKKRNKNTYTLKDVIREIGTNVDKENLNSEKAVDVVRAYGACLQKARKIIRNTEYGIFPGAY